MPTRSQLVIDDLVALWRAKNTLVWIGTREERRAEACIAQAARSKLFKAPFAVRCWDVFSGLTDEKGAVVDAGLADPRAILNYIRDRNERTIYVLRDMHKWLGPDILRGLRSIANQLQLADKDSARSIVILSPSADVPPELTEVATVVDFPLPDREEIGAVFDKWATFDKTAATLTREERDRAIDAAVGLAEHEAANCYARSIVTLKKIDPALVTGEKRRIISREKVLTWYDPDPRGLDAIGGLERLKAWATQRKAAFSQDAREYGLPAPKGVLIVGVSGTGKSLAAKSIPTALGVPLLRLDMGGLKSKFVGESEANVRRAFAVAEAVAPCVLWLDECEKALAGVSGPAGDGGVAADAFGALLTWMQDQRGVFVVATANDVSGLPPEFLRKGRFDEMFFVDLPTRKERAEVVEVTRRVYGTAIGDLDVDALARATEGFTGAEIAAIFPEAMFTAYTDGRRPVSTEDLQTVIANTTPLSTTAAEKIEKLREWAKSRARMASAPEVITTAGDGTRNLDIS